MPTKKKDVAPKRPRGRPRSHPTAVGLSLLPDYLKRLDAYAAKEELSRSMAARRLIEAALDKIAGRKS